MWSKTNGGDNRKFKMDHSKKTKTSKPSFLSVVSHETLPIRFSLMFRKCSICQKSLCVKWIVSDAFFARERKCIKSGDEETELNFMNLTQTNMVL